MTEEEIELLKQEYLCDSNISTTDELIDESIATLESYFELMNIDDLHKNARLIFLPYLALIAVKKDKAMTCISVKDRLPEPGSCVLVSLYAAPEPPKEEV